MENPEKYTHTNKEGSSVKRSKAEALLRDGQAYLNNSRFTWQVDLVVGLSIEPHAQFKLRKWRNNGNERGVRILDYCMTIYVWTLCELPEEASISTQQDGMYSSPHRYVLSLAEE